MEDTEKQTPSEGIEPDTPEQVDPAVPEQADATGRLAEEFLRLTEEFPALQSPSQLPDEVLDVAVTEGIPLLDAYLRHRWQEEKRVQAAAAKQAQAASNSAGSLAAGSRHTAPEQDAFLRAFRRAL